MKIVSIIEDEKLEIDVNRFIHRIIDFRHHLTQILEHYNVRHPEEIKKMIEQKKIEAHPAYEDYLDAISYRLEIEKLVKNLDICMEKVRSMI